MKQLVWIDTETQVVVPREPTGAMLVAGGKERGWGVYSAMLAAAPEVKLAGGAKAEPKAYFAEVWNGKSIAECLTFQKNVQVLGQQVEELKRLQVFLDNALTTPEKEARGHEIAAKSAKLKGDNESMSKLYNGFSIERPYQFTATKAVIATPISNEEFAKISAAKDFKPETIISTGEKKWMPMNLAGLALAVARPLIGRVEVLLAKKPPGASIGSASCVTLALSSRFSNTASMIRSQSARSPTWAI